MSALPLTTDTITAIATAAGPAGVGIVRVSGPEAFTVVDRLTASAGRRSARKQPGHTLRRVAVHDPETHEILDDALLAIFHAPRSLTGEDVAEIQGHGGGVTLKQVLAATLAAGARLARPGEFSERAFANGKIDLAQAEAVADLVTAETVAAQQAARRQLSGELSRFIQDCRSDLQEALAYIEASIDFPEEVGEIDPDTVDPPLHRAMGTLTALLATASYGRRLREGITVVLTGRPNTGKSSLLNALAGADRAIVTPVPGTTRDIVEEAVSVEGIPVRALDTAGLRETSDPVEQIGVARAQQAVADADVVVAVLDTVSGMTEDDSILLASLAGRPAVVVVNKADLADPEPVLAAVRTLLPAVPTVATAAPTGAGLSDLRQALARAATGDETTASEKSSAAVPLVTSARHEAALREAQTAVEHARSTLAQGLPAELIAVDAHGALQVLGRITGETAREDIIRGIFERFCIGK